MLCNESKLWMRMLEERFPVPGKLKTRNWKSFNFLQSPYTGWLRSFVCHYIYIMCVCNTRELAYFCSVPCSRSHYCLVSPIDTPNAIHTFLSTQKLQPVTSISSIIYTLFFLLRWLSHLGLIIIFILIQYAGHTLPVCFIQLVTQQYIACI